MYYRSTRNAQLRYSASRAIAQGLSREGGLFVPEQIPQLTGELLAALQSMDYRQRAVAVMGLFLEEFTPEELSRFAESAYTEARFDAPEIAPLRALDANTFCLELWHGPTCAFKDMALQMLPHLLTASLQKTGEQRIACILAATSGDTGKAAMEGFRDVDRTRIMVFYPKDGVSEVQQLQMVTQEGANVGVCAVEGNFDDAQTGVKRLFSDEALREELSRRGYFFSSANSINWGRVLPQVVYYISAYADLVARGSLKAGDPVNFCVPTGNFGNILAAYYAGQMGLPIHRLICASNSNNVLTDFLRTGVYDRNRPFYTTTSPSMDILISSNLERLIFALSGENNEQVRGYMDTLSRTGRYEVSEDIKTRISDLFAAGYATEADTARVISAMWRERNYLIDPHTAVAFHVLETYRQSTGDTTPTVVASTASPFKFGDAVLNALGKTDLPGGIALLDCLSAATGVSAPRPLEALKAAVPRFDACVEKSALEQAVLEFLG